MLPGVATGAAELAQLRQGGLAAVCVPHNPAPLAVGEVVLSGDQAAAGGKGRLLTVLHVYRDCLWELAPPHQATPNAGFLVRAHARICKACAAADAFHSAARRGALAGARGAAGCRRARRLGGRC